MVWWKMACDEVVCDTGVQSCVVKDGVAKMACDRERARRRKTRRRRWRGIQNQKQEPHTKMWGKTNRTMLRAGIHSLTGTHLQPLGRAYTHKL